MATVGLLGLIIFGFVVGWFFHEVTSARAVRSAESRAAGLSGQIGALRAELEERKAEVAELQRTLRESESKSAEANARSDELRRAIEEQRTLLQQARDALTDAFQSIAAEALSRNSERFLALARENLGAIEQRALADLDARHKAIEGVVVPLKESLQKMDDQLRALESSRGQAYAALSTQLKSLVDTQDDYVPRPLIWSTHSAHRPYEVVGEKSSSSAWSK